jgi:CubicO group peptidase (beta-lactamase class C family)
VHDGNAYFMDGAAGHAGLFSTAEETLAIARQFLPSTTTLIDPKLCELFSTDLTPEDATESRSFGFQLATTVDSTAGTLMSPESYGHLGFTGTSLWIDSKRDATFILLTNRTHAHALPFANINAARREFHDLSCAAIDGDS